MSDMALRHAVLASLLEGEASGYQLAKRFDVAVANFWYAQPQQLYAELARLEQAGLVAGRRVLQEKRPNKRVYQITAAGRAELEKFVAQPAKPTTMKDDLLVKVAAADDADVDAAVAAIDERAAQAEAKLALYERLAAVVRDGRDEQSFLRDAARVGPYLTLRRGIAFEQENVLWCRWASDVLRARGGRRSRTAAEKPGSSPRPRRSAT
jgi:DNA-binding PadR family transcriptional regulator